MIVEFVVANIAFVVVNVVFVLVIVFVVRVIDVIPVDATDVDVLVWPLQSLMMVLLFMPKK